MSDSEKENNNQIPQQEEKAYMKPYVIDVEGIKEKMAKDSAEYSGKQRFGFFSIIHPSHIGDQNYSTKKVYEIENGKVKTEPRGIYTKTTKKGKFIDSYFDAGFLQDDKKTVELKRIIAEEEQKARLDKVIKGKDKSKFKTPFKPTGHYEFKDILYPDNQKYTVPLYRVANNRKNINFKDKKVLSGPRNILTSPLKSGEFCMNGVCFSYHKTAKEDVERFKEMTEKEKQDELERKKQTRKEIKEGKREFKNPFVPNSIAKNSTFHTDKEIYGLAPEYKEKILKTSELRQKSLEKKDNKFAKHDKSFKPNSYEKSVSFIIK